jgi:hypothetical protein
MAAIAAEATSVVKNCERDEPCDSEVELPEVVAIYQ